MNLQKESSMPDFPSVATLIPHRDPAIVVDKILSFENGAIRCERTVGSDEHYGPGLSSEGIVEFCAQSALCKEALASSGGPKTGVIAGIDDFAFFKNATAGDVLVVETATRTKFGKLSVFECTVFRGALHAEKIAHGHIKAALT
jgi:3-hydroxymyristoyl/3-hydroxydecanoyl-(acyl carrier protein) dehydratase